MADPAGPGGFLSEERDRIMKLFGGKKSGPRPSGLKAGPGGKPMGKKKKLKGWQIALIVVGALLGLLLGVYGFIRLYAKPPDVTAEKKPDKPQLGEKKEGDEEDPFADLVEPFIEEGDRERKEDYFTFMLCGTDNDGTRTDTIIVASYDVKAQQVNMVNIPRDTMSNVKRKIKKINGGFGGGPEQLERELEMLLGIPIDRYVVVSFEGFKELIDLIDGVDFNVPTYMVWDDPTQDLHIFLEPGMQHLDGEKAIQLVRFRQNNPGVKGGYAEGDIGRIKMQQEFLQTIAKKLLSPSNLIKVGDLASAVIRNTETNLSLSELTWFGMKALNMNYNNIQMTTLPGHAAYLYEPDYGHMQSYFVPERENILEMVNELLNPYQDQVTKLNLIDVSRYSSKAPAGSGSQNKDPSGKDDAPPDNIDDQDRNESGQSGGSSSNNDSRPGGGSNNSGDQDPGTQPPEGVDPNQPDSDASGDANQPDSPDVPEAPGGADAPPEEGDNQGGGEPPAENPPAPQPPAPESEPRQTVEPEAQPEPQP